MNNKVICHQGGSLFMKCNKCNHTWNVPVSMWDEVEVVCPNCKNEDGAHLEVVHKTMGAATVDIPEFMAKPKQLITLEEKELTDFIDREAQIRIDKFNLGFRYGLCLGLLVTVIAIAIFMSILFIPLNVLLA